ncbi:MULTISPECIES: DUF4926 domain-containing protein [Photorhabdus]|uniref:DUF4926 domain-containing protein n=1 Tax=Photorhabdus TaxID=29487 RepID=UPI00058CCF64|nr:MULTISPECIES: DUF4926 domain-containing protein [Photorhabdus]MBS9427515.1 DUF4926 domain-containing protein [Photorhabdus akhurstii]MCC8457979.1 DUF4926 domain-containing protein [Photorhabdus aegyptia]PQQ35816.1 DUF4926 domain-containing protein [Photorhabdus luminescens]
MKYSLFDVVILTSDIPERGLKTGMKGAIIDVYSEQEEAYEVEFCDEDGRTIDMLPLYANQLSPFE